MSSGLVSRRSCSFCNKATVQRRLSNNITSVYTSSTKCWKFGRKVGRCLPKRQSSVIQHIATTYGSIAAVWLPAAPLFLRLLCFWPLTSEPTRATSQFSRPRSRNVLTPKCVRVCAPSTRTLYDILTLMDKKYSVFVFLLCWKVIVVLTRIGRVSSLHTRLVVGTKLLLLRS